MKLDKNRWSNPKEPFLEKLSGTKNLGLMELWRESRKEAAVEVKLSGEDTEDI